MERIEPAKSTTATVGHDRLPLDELTMLRGALIAMRSEAVDRAAYVTDGTRDAAVSPGSDPAHHALVSDSVARAQELVVDIDDALGRMNEGCYGLCQVCGQEIALERLEAIPQTRTCVRCSAQRPRLVG